MPQATHFNIFVKPLFCSIFCVLLYSAWALLHLFRKHLAQLNKTAVKDIDLCYVFPPIVFMDFEEAAAVLQKNLYRFIFRIYNPIFPYPCLLV